MMSYSVVELYTHSMFEYLFAGVAKVPVSIQTKFVLRIQKLFKSDSIVLMVYAKDCHFNTLIRYY